MYLFITPSRLELSPSQLDNDSQECALHSRSLLQREVTRTLCDGQEMEVPPPLR